MKNSGKIWTAKKIAETSSCEVIEIARAMANSPTANKHLGLLEEFAKQIDESTASEDTVSPVAKPEYQVCHSRYLEAIGTSRCDEYALLRSAAVLWLRNSAKLHFFFCQLDDTLRMLNCEVPKLQLVTESKPLMDPGSCKATDEVYLFLTEIQKLDYSRLIECLGFSFEMHADPENMQQYYYLPRRTREIDFRLLDMRRLSKMCHQQNAVLNRFSADMNALIGGVLDNPSQRPDKAQFKRKLCIVKGRFMASAIEQWGFGDGGDCGFNAYVAASMDPRRLLDNRHCVLSEVNTCSHCLRVKPVSLCGRCHIPAYCSVGCQKDDYVRHKPECIRERNMWHRAAKFEYSPETRDAWGKAHAIKTEKSNEDLTSSCVVRTLTDPSV